MTRSIAAWRLSGENVDGLLLGERGEFFLEKMLFIRLLGRRKMPKKKRQEDREMDASPVSVTAVALAFPPSVNQPEQVVCVFARNEKK